VAIDKSAAAGPASLEVQVVDATTGQVYNTAPDEIQVTTPPPWYVKYLWLIVLIIILILAAVAAVLLARKISRDRKNVRGLVVTLRRGGVLVGRDLPAADTKYAEVFPFIIRDAQSSPRLDYPPRGVSTGIYYARRAGYGLARLTTPTGLRPYEVELGGPAQEVEDGLEVAITDTRKPGRGGRRVNRPGGASGSGTGYPGTTGAPGAAVPGGYIPDPGYPGGTDYPGGGYTPDPVYSPPPGYSPAQSSPFDPTVPTTPVPAPPPSYDPTTYDPGTTPTRPITRPSTYEPPKNPWIQ